MNRLAIITIGAIILLLLGIAGYVLLVHPRAGSDTGPTASSTNPFGQLGTNTAAGDRTYPLVLSDGTTVSVEDFTKTNQPEWAGPWGYKVAGNESDVYLITYIEPDTAGAQGSFVITLLAEPLGAVRREAEAALRARLAIPDGDICKLDVTVASAIGVNSAYDGQKLGLSFCPGAVKLP